MNLISSLFLLLKGMVVGVANIIPGVSGGTMAVVMGIYDHLIEAIGGFLTDKKKRVAHFIFLTTIAVGAVIGIILLAPGIEYALENHYALTMLFFMGLIAGSTPTVFKESGLKSISFSNMVWLSLGIITVLLLSGSSEDKESIKATAESVSIMLLFASMMIAGGAMIIPGVSGSLVMILLGVYPIILHAINKRELQTLAIAAAGAGIGVLVFSKLIGFLLKHASAPTHSFIIGLVSGSIVILFHGFPEGNMGWAMGSISFLLGSTLAYLSALTPKTN